MVQETLDPDNSPKTTSYAYYDSDSPFTPAGSLVPLKLLTRSDGSWEYYQYDSSGRKTAVYSGVGNLACDGSAVPDANQCRLVQYFYDSSYVSGSGDTGTLKPSLPRLTVETLLGSEISRSYLVVLSGERREIRCQTPNAPWSASDNLVTTRKYFTSGANLFRLLSVKYPDGTIVIYDYASNGYGGETTTVLSGQPNAAGTSILDGLREVAVRDGLGNLVSQVTTDFVSQGVLGSQTPSLPDAFGRPQHFTFLDGTFEEFGTGCCGPIYQIDRDGVATTNVYDPAKRLTGTIRLGVTQTNLLDVAGNLLQTIRFVPNKSPVILRQATNDLSGSIIAETNGLGGRTTFSESTDGSGQKVRTTTYPDGGTRIETYFRDGSPASHSGTAGQLVRYEYGVTGNTPFTKEIRMLSPTTDSSEWVCNYTDLIGRNFKTVYAAASGTPKQERFFNAKGQLEKETDPDQVTTLYRYNSKGERIVTAVDVNGDAKVGYYDAGATGADRVTQTTSAVLTSGATANTRGMDIRRTETLVWTNAISADTAKVSTVDASPNGLHTWQVSYRDQSTPVTRQSDTSIPTSGNSWTRTITQTEADGSSTVTTSQNGRTVSISRKANGGAEIGRTTYGYDAEGHPYQVSDLRNGTATQTYNAADMVATTTTPPPGMGQLGLTTITDYDISLRAWRITQPDGAVVTNKYDVTGMLTNTFGSRTYPVAYSYDYAGRMQTMKTWTNFSLGNGAAVTTWNYNQYRGWLDSKRYADTSGPDYTYTAGGRLKTRQWSRLGTSSARIQTTYTYGFDDGNSGNDYGDLGGISYANDPQNTASVTYTYDRRGRQSTVLQNGMTNTFIYNDANQVTSEGYSGGTLAGFTVGTGFDSYLRRNSLSLNTSPTTSVSYGYDNASRLQTVTMGSQSATYSYVANSPLVEQIALKQSGSSVMTTTKSYDYLNRLGSIASTPSVSYTYDYNTAGQRVRSMLGDGSSWLYEYDALGQIRSGRKYWSDGSPVGGQQFEYAHDDIGNRTSTKVGGDADGQNLRAASYTANNLNQYISRSVTGAVYVTGIALATNPVTVNTLSASRKGEYFWKELLTNNSSAPIWMTITTSATAETSVAGNVFIPKTTEQFYPDADGDLTNDGRWTFTWDAENRLVRMVANTAVGPQQRIDLGYDWEGRRISKKVWNNTAGSGNPAVDQRFVYDSWNLIAVLGSSGSVIQSFAWGLDLSGSLLGAGGVGGLLVINDTANGAHFCAYDGNGNIAALVKTDGTVSARYEYGPFGEALRATGPMAKANPFRFSTKYQDDESDLLYYGYRYYNPSSGRWINRDPITEDGGLNIYALISNDSLNRTDMLGLAAKPYDNSCCTGEKLKESKNELIGRFNETKQDFAGIGCKPGGAGSTSCVNVNTTVLLTLSPTPACWTCQLEHRFFYNDWQTTPEPNRRDHWAVVCKSQPTQGKGEEILFDFWGDRNPAEDPNKWFRNRYKFPDPTPGQKAMADDCVGRCKDRKRLRVKDFPIGDPNDKNPTKN